MNYRDLFQIESVDATPNHIVIFDGATDVLEPITVSLANFPGYTNGLRVISDLVKFGDNNEDNIICITDPTWCSYEFYLCDPITYTNEIFLAGGSVEIFSNESFDNACDICRIYCPTTSTTPAPTTPTPTTCPWATPGVIPPAPPFSLPTTKNGTSHAIITTTTAPTAPLIDVIMTTTSTTTSTTATTTSTTSKPIITSILPCKVGCNSLNF